MCDLLSAPDTKQTGSINRLTGYKIGSVLGCVCVYMCVFERNCVRVCVSMCVCVGGSTQQSSLCSSWQPFTVSPPSSTPTTKAASKHAVNAC